jgi:hypothetical protein
MMSSLLQIFAPTLVPVGESDIGRWIGSRAGSIKHVTGRKDAGTRRAVAMIGARKWRSYWVRLLAVSLFLSVMSASVVKAEKPESEPAMSREGEPREVSSESAHGVMDAALRDLDQAIQMYQTGADPFAARSHRHYSQPEDSASSVSSEKDPWEELLLTRNSRVQAWQDYFLGPALPRLLAAFDRLAPSRNHVAQTFSQMGLPEELIAVAFVESGLTSNTVSSKGAFGAWQFMPATAAQYGLKRNVWEDERTDFDKSTVAAARYLADLHRLFGDWALALAAYNAGQDRVLEAIAKGKTRDFWTLSEQGLLPEETLQYVPKVLGTARAWKTMLLGPGGTDRPKPVLSASGSDRQAWTYALRLEELGN